MFASRKPVAGWRQFHCEECNDKRWIATRDCNSPSAEDCRKCHEWVRPIDCLPDASLETDQSGNLKKYPPDKVE